MSITLEVDNSDVDLDLTSVRLAEDSFMVLNDRVDETILLDDSKSVSEESQPESSDNSSFLDIDLEDDSEDEEIDTTESIDLDEQQVNQELDEVSGGMLIVILKLHLEMICLQVDVEATEQSHAEEDLCSSIPGMYRILDLISERGTSGLGMMNHDVSA